jgi:hypothetical protein
MLDFIVVVVIVIIFQARAVPFQIQRRIVKKRMNEVELKFGTDCGARGLTMHMGFDVCRTVRRRWDARVE